MRYWSDFISAVYTQLNARNQTVLFGVPNKNDPFSTGTKKQSKKLMQAISLSECKWKYSLTD